MFRHRQRYIAERSLLVRKHRRQRARYCVDCRRCTHFYGRLPDRCLQEYRITTDAYIVYDTTTPNQNHDNSPIATSSHARTVRSSVHPLPHRAADPRPLRRWLRLRAHDRRPAARRPDYNGRAPALLHCRGWYRSRLCRGRRGLWFLGRDGREGHLHRVVGDDAAGGSRTLGTVRWSFFA